MYPTSTPVSQRYSGRRLTGVCCSSTASCTFMASPTKRFKPSFASLPKETTILEMAGGTLSLEIRTMSAAKRKELREARQRAATEPQLAAAVITEGLRRQYKTQSAPQVASVPVLTQAASPATIRRFRPSFTQSRQDSINLVVGGGSLLEVRTLSADKKRELKQAAQQAAASPSSWQPAPRKVATSCMDVRDIVVEQSTSRTAAAAAAAVECRTSSLQRPLPEVAGAGETGCSSTMAAETTAGGCSSSSSSSSNSSRRSNAIQQQTRGSGSQGTVLGAAKSAGLKRLMEDRHVALPDWNPHNLAVSCSYAAVFDGHYGSEAADLAAAKLHQHLSRFLPTSDEAAAALCDEVVSAALESAFQTLDQEILDQFRVDPAQQKSGAAALAALRLGDRLYTANAGDCRAVLCRGTVAVPLTTDHKPNVAEERARVEGMGGQVANQRGWRVLMGERDGLPARGVAVSRGLGDLHFKEPLPLLTSTPDVSSTHLTPEDSFLILGSDGLWDRMSNQMAVEVVHKVVMEGRRGGDMQQAANDAAKALMYRALDRGTQDNVTAVVMMLQ